MKSANLPAAGLARPGWGSWVGILVSSVAMTRFFTRSNLQIGLTSFREYGLPWRKEHGGRQIHDRCMLLSSHACGQEARSL